MRKYLLLLVCFLFYKASLSQNEIQYGLKINAGWKINTHHSKTTGLWSSENGYGFSAGVPVRLWRSDVHSFDTGLEYEYTAFDYYAFNTLQSSFRIQSLGIPMLYNSNFYKNWYVQFGGGIHYNVAVNSWVLGFKQSQKNITNDLQPYLALGASSLVERNDLFFEFGVQARYFFRDIWDNETATYQSTSSKLLIFDFVLKFYI